MQKDFSMVSGVSQSIYNGPQHFLFGILLYLFLTSSVWRRRAEKKRRRGTSLRWEAEMRGWGGERKHKGMKREMRGEEEDVWRAGSSGQIPGRNTCHWRGSCFPSPSFFSSLFPSPSISFVRQQEGHPRRKKGVLKIPPFLPVSISSPKDLVSIETSYLHTELIQSAGMNVCVGERGR